MGINPQIELEQALEKIELGGTHNSGLKWTSKKSDEQDANVYISLEQAESFGAEAVYFRYFEDGRPPRPQVYIYSCDNLDIAKQRGPDIHHHLWNAGLVPYCFIFGASQILVFNCGKKPDIDSSGENFTTKPDDVINLLSKIQSDLLKYSAKKFDSGLFWDSEKGKDFKYDQSAYEQLLVQLKNVKANIISRVGKEKSGLVKRILMMLILIKYLEERKDEYGKGALDPDEFYKSFNPDDPTLIGALKNPEIFISVLAELSSEEHFNGQIFFLSDEEKRGLEEIDLVIFHHFVKGDTSFFSSAKQGIGQMSLWRLYQFNYLPIELISHIYEDFLANDSGQKKKGVVYTPPYLVQFLIDKSMPLNNPQDNFKILDPACGSGIFLVGAFKRMIQWWRVKNEWKRPQKENIEEMKQILLNNIFGCDLEEEAVTLSYFSLGLALLDALSPKEIWNNVHFDNLIGKNLISGDFFKTLAENLLDNNFDLVIGNPPFESKLTHWATLIDQNEKKGTPSRPDVPYNQIALLFLEQSLRILNPGGSSCLILPSGPVLYNTKTHGFKKYLFENNYFKEIYDFTPLRAKLFIGSSSSAKPSVVAVFAKQYKPVGEPIHHLIFRRTRASGEKIEFEIDSYDIHSVNYKTALNVPSIWQANFMGGGRLQNILNRLSGASNLEVFLKDKKANSNWIYGEGWQECPDSKPLVQIQELLKITNRSTEQEQELKKLESKHKASWITGHKLMEADGSIEVCNKEYFQWPRNEQLFKPPHLLVKESVTGKNIPVFFSNDHITFKDKIFGINVPREQEEELRALGNYLVKDNNVALMWLLSGQVLTSREGVPLMTDILSLPYPEIDFNEIEKVILEDVTNHYSDFRKKGEKSEILQKVSKGELDSFGSMFCEVLNSVYMTFKPLPPVTSDEFVAFPFMLGDIPEMEIPDSLKGMEEKLRILINNRQSYNLWIKRIIKVYNKNVIILYKPNQKRYWLKSVAIRDADETFMDLYKQGK